MLCSRIDHLLAQGCDCSLTEIPVCPITHTCTSKIPGFCELRSRAINRNPDKTSPTFLYLRRYRSGFFRYVRFYATGCDIQTQNSNQTSSGSFGCVASLAVDSDCSSNSDLSAMSALHTSQSMRGAPHCLTSCLPVFSTAFFLVLSFFFCPALLMVCWLQWALSDWGSDHLPVLCELLPQPTSEAPKATEQEGRAKQP